MTMCRGAQNIEIIFRVNQFLAFENPPDGFSLCDRDAGEIGDGALDGLFALTSRFTQEDGWWGFAVRDDIDLHGRTLQDCQ
jgi:hypothetical protein